MKRRARPSCLLGLMKMGEVRASTQRSAGVDAQLVTLDEASDWMFRKRTTTGSGAGRE